MDSILKDLRFALRTMLKHPAFSAVAIITLALGIGGSTSIFTVVDAALLRGLPYRSPDHLYHLWEQTPKVEYPKREFSYPDYQDYQKSQLFEVAAYSGSGAILSGSGESEMSLRLKRAQTSFPFWASIRFSGEHFNREKTLPVQQKRPSSLTGSGNVSLAATGEWSDVR
jgi:hypothetical protein